MRIRQFAGLGMNVEDSYMIGAQIADQEEAVVRRDRDAVGMRIFLTGRVRPEVSKLLVIFEIQAYDRLTERAVWLDVIRTDRGAEVVRHEGGMAGRVDRNIGRSCASRRNLTCLLKRPGERIQRKSRYSCRGIVDCVDRVNRAVPRAGGGPRKMRR